jgi:ribose 5-phosphate isomerase B
MITLELGCDHAGFELKEQIKKTMSHVAGAPIRFLDQGTFSLESMDYPDVADKVCAALKKDPAHLGLLICGSGQGMAMRANKFPFIRAALCHTVESAKLAREHNDANVLCLGARNLDLALAQKIVETFLTTKFAGGRHTQRVQKLSRDA